MTKFHKAIRHMSNKKALEADDFLAEFYEELWPTIAPTLYGIVTYEGKWYTLSVYEFCQHQPYPHTSIFVQYNF